MHYKGKQFQFQCLVNFLYSDFQFIYNAIPVCREAVFGQISGRSLLPYVTLMVCPPWPGQSVFPTYRRPQGQEMTYTQLIALQLTDLQSGVSWKSLRDAGGFGVENGLLVWVEDKVWSFLVA